MQTTLIAFNYNSKQTPFINFESKEISGKLITPAFDELLEQLFT